MEHPPAPLRKGEIFFSVAGWQEGGRSPATRFSLCHKMLAYGGRSGKSLGSDYGEVTLIARIMGHRDLPNVAKECPCFDARGEYQFL